MNSENIKIISSTIDRETKEGKIVIEVEEVPEEVKLNILIDEGEGHLFSLVERGIIFKAMDRYAREYGYQLVKDSNQVNPNQNLSDRARDHAKEVEKFYSPTIEAYRLRAKNSFEAGYNSAKEIPDMIVGVWIKVSDKKPNSWDRVPVRFIHTQLPIYDGRVYAEQHPELIEWLEPIQLKDLLAK